MKKRFGIFLLLCAQLLAMPAVAADSYAVGYALLVVSNQQGQGQDQLKFAKNDAMLMKSVLTELGRYIPDNIEVLIDPKSGELTETLQEFERIITERTRRNEKSVFLFYYSGHARSAGLNLGQDEVSLASLRQHIEKLSATVTLIILDACQSGAISNVKGVQPAADFSYNSVEKLNTEGTVVMASSTSSELSQESRDLKGSFFTHHLTVGMRGAADKDRNGIVTLSEAYDYAYNTTLRSTAATAVGKQHATLETDLRGRGEMIMTWPMKSSSKIELPAELSGEILITHVESNTVFAEIHKAAGEALPVALRPGKYEALVKLKENEGRRCEIVLAANGISRLEIEDCEKIELKNDPVKSLAIERYAELKPDRKEHLFAELHVGWFTGRQTGYTSTLNDFRYDGAGDKSGAGAKVGIVYTLLKYLSVSLVFSKLDDRTANRNLFSGDGNQVSWATRRLGLHVRGNLPLLKGMILPYLQAGGGYAWSRFRFAYGEDGADQTDETIHGYHLAGALGVQLNPWKNFGFTLAELEYVYAPSVENDLGDVHDSGGFALMTGLRAGF